MIMLLRIADAGGLNLLVGFNVLIFVPKFSAEIKILCLIGSNWVGLALRVKNRGQSKVVLDRFRSPPYTQF